MGLVKGLGFRFIMGLNVRGCNTHGSFQKMGIPIIDPKIL